MGKCLLFGGEGESLIPNDCLHQQLAQLDLLLGVPHEVELPESLHSMGVQEAHDLLCLPPGLSDLDEHLMKPLPHLVGGGGDLSVQQKQKSKAATETQATA